MPHVVTNVVGRAAPIARPRFDAARIGSHRTGAGPGISRLASRGARPENRVEGDRSDYVVALARSESEAPCARRTGIAEAGSPGAPAAKSSPNRTRRKELAITKTSPTKW